jgi:tripartite-type tricarboxylate transporter receptor subunit TctC
LSSLVSLLARGTAALGLAAAGLVLAATAPAWAQFPDKPVTIIVPYAPGGGNDITARFVAEQLSKIWPQPVVVENQPGAGTAIGSAYVAQAAPDGYTLLFISVTYTTMAAVSPDLPFDPATDLLPVAEVGTVPLGLAAGPKTPVATVQDLVAAAKAGELVYSTSGPGTINQFAAELFDTVAGVDTQPIHYKGGSEAITALMSGEVDLYFGSLLQLESFINAGQVTGLMVTGTERVPSVPGLPTPAEAGLAGAEVDLWWGMFAPAGTPAEVVDTINAAVNQVLGQQATIDFLAQGGAVPTPGTPAAFNDVVQSELVMWRDIAEKNNIVAE